MDIFTILVFFLLVNAGSTEVLPTPKNITLPDSIAEKPPTVSLVLAVNNEVLTLQGKPIITVEQIQKSKSKTIKALAEALSNYPKQQLGKNQHALTIMADKQIPYQLLKKIMLTSASVDYGKLSFAVNQKVAKVEE